MSLYCDILSRADAFPSQRQGARASALDSLARAAVIAIAALVSVFAAWQFVMPETFVSVRGLNPLAVAAWRAHLGWHPAFVSLPVYTAVFRGLIALPFAAYALLLWCVARGARIDFRFALALAAVLCLALAVAMPASLSTDVFAYVGYGRLRVVHGLNPHLATQVDLVRLGDPTAPYLHWPIPSPYGPLWTLLSMALVALAPAQSVWGVVVAFKLGAALAVLAAGAAGRATVGRLAAAEAGAIGDRVAPGTPVPPGSAPRADAIFAAIAFNPLLLIEGPGNGHNDVIMVALLMAGFAALAGGGKRINRAAIWFGVAAAVKLVPLILVPWLAVLAVRAHASAPARRRLVVGLIAFGLAVAPVGLAYLPFWSGARTWDGLAAHAPAHVLSQLLGRIWPVFPVLLWGWLAVCFGRGDPVLRLATVWAAVGLALVVFGARLWFPWYLAWIWPAIVLRFNRPHLILAALSLLFSLLLMFAYAIA